MGAVNDLLQPGKCPAENDPSIAGMMDLAGRLHDDGVRLARPLRPSVESLEAEQTQKLSLRSGMRHPAGRGCLKRLGF